MASEDMVTNRLTASLFVCGCDDGGRDGGNDGCDACDVNLCLSVGVSAGDGDGGGDGDANEGVMMRTAPMIRARRLQL